MSDINIIQPTMPLPLAVAIGGMRDTSLKVHNFTWATFKDRLKKPQIGGKDGSYYIRGSELRQPRRADDNLLSAKTIILDGDSSVDPETGEITPGAPDLHLVAGALKDMGITFCAHTSHSFVPGKLWKYRIIIPADIQDQRALDASVSWLISQLHSRGIWLADVTENHRWSQPWYSSRVSDREALKDFLFVEHDADSFPLQKAMDALRLAEKQAEKEEQARRSQVVQQRPEGNIQAFNKAFTLSDARSTLERAGYRFGYYDKANNSYRFMRPGSETKTYGAVLFQGAMGDWCTYSHHGSADPLSSRVCDPFELVAVLQHGGDLKAAARALFPKEKSVVEKLQERAQKQSPPPFEGEPKNILGNSGKNFLLESQMNQGHLPNGDDFGSKHPHAALHSPYLGTTPHEVQKVEQSQALKKRVSLIPWADLRDEPVRWLVDGLIPAASFAAIFGKPGSYKSFAALYLGAMIATGREAFGRATTQGPVIYIAGEGGAGLKRRRDAIMRQHGLPQDAPVYFIKAQLNLATTLEDRDALLAEIRAIGVKPALVVIDTFARMTAGIEENSAKDVGAAIAIMGSIEQETGAAVLIVHHSGKAQDAGMRGSSALLAAVDAELHCEKLTPEGSSDRMGRIKITKMKDGEDDLVLGFRMNVVALSDIDPSQTSLALEPMEDDELAGIKTPSRVKLNADAIKMMEALKKAIAEEGQPIPTDRAPKGTKGVTENLWREYWKMMTNKKGGTERTAWSRAYEKLEDAHMFGFWADYVWITKEPEPIQAPAQKSQALETYDDIPFP
jgi:RecA-family ATPase